jgi:hypothetical protein
MEPEKIQAIRDYLQEKFPGMIHADMDDSKRTGHKFKITTPKYVLLTSITQELINDSSQKEIIAKFNNIDLAMLLIDNPKSTIVVRSFDFKIEHRD